MENGVLKEKWFLVGKVLLSVLYYIACATTQPVPAEMVITPDIAHFNTWCAIGGAKLIKRSHLKVERLVFMKKDYNKKTTTCRKGFTMQTYSIIIFGIVGFTFFAVGLLFILNSSSSQAVEIPAVITDIEERANNGFIGLGFKRIVYSAHVEYTIHEQVYQGHINEYAYGWQVGDTITIYCDPDNPQSIHAGVGSLLGSIFACFGGVFLTISFVVLILSVSQSRKHRWLMQNGQKVYVPITEIQLVRQEKINHQHPYRIVCRWQGPTGDRYEFYSRNLLENPSAVLAKAGVTEMAVYMDKNQPQRYAMDHSILEKLTISVV